MTGPERQTSSRIPQYTSEFPQDWAIPSKPHVFQASFPGSTPYLCVFSWALQAAGSEKALLHSLQEKGFSPVWIRMCRLKFPVWVNSFPQS